jgi:hypothetical protein
MLQESLWEADCCIVTLLHKNAERRYAAGGIKFKEVGVQF